MKTLKQIYKENFEKYGAVLDEKRKEIRCNKIEFLTRKVGYTIAIPCSRIKDQETLDDLNRKYTVYVHYGVARHYELTKLDVSKCVPTSKSKALNAQKCYFSCDNLPEYDAIELFRKIIEDNL